MFQESKTCFPNNRLLRHRNNSIIVFNFLNCLFSTAEVKGNQLGEAFVITMNFYFEVTHVFYCCQNNEECKYKFEKIDNDFYDGYHLCENCVCSNVIDQEYPFTYAALFLLKTDIIR